MTMETERARVSVEYKLLLFRKLVRIRVMEDRVEGLNRTGHIPGFLHGSIGQEAVAVGVCEALQASDYVFSTHRAHGHFLAKGADLRAMICELYGKAPGQNKGKGGTMHVSDFSVNMLGANGMVGASMTLGVGAALSAKLRRSGQVCVSFFGEGVAGNGAFHEALNLASTLSVPAIFVCENNLYAHESPASYFLPTPDVAARGPSYRIQSWIVDGNDVLAVLATARRAVEHARGESRPVLIEAKTYRQRGHHFGDSGRHYRPAAEIQAWLDRDPIKRLREELLHDGLDEARLQDEFDLVTREVDDAIEFAEQAPYPDVEDALRDVLSENGG